MATTIADGALLTVRQGNTGPLLQVGVTDAAGNLIDLTGYTCQLEVPTAGTPISRAISSIVSNRFQVQLTPAETETMPVGKHRISVEVENAGLSVPYRVEVIYTFDIVDQINTA